MRIFDKTYTLQVCLIDEETQCMPFVHNYAQTLASPSKHMHAHIWYYIKVLKCWTTLYMLKIISLQKMFVICSFYHAAQLCATHYRTPGLVTNCIIYRLLCLMIGGGATSLINMWGHVTTVSTCISGTEECNAADTGHDTHPVTVHGCGADMWLCYPLMWNVTLEYTTAHFNVLGQTRSGNPSPTFHTHHRKLNLMILVWW